MERWPSNHLLSVIITVESLWSSRNAVLLPFSNWSQREFLSLPWRPQGAGLDHTTMLIASLGLCSLCGKTSPTQFFFPWKVCVWDGGLARPMARQQVRVYRIWRHRCTSSWPIVSKVALKKAPGMSLITSTLSEVGVCLQSFLPLMECNHEIFPSYNCLPSACLLSCVVCQGLYLE